MKTIHHTYELVVIGGGLAGLCAAVTAARQGVRTALVHDRPVLGGNASIEIRVPPVGATQCNFTYSRETGLIEQLFLNNLHHNPTWCPKGWNLEIESLARNEPKLDLFLNNAVCDVAMNEGKDRIQNIKAYCSMDETWHVLADHHIHALELAVEGDIAPIASVTASSVFSEADPVESWGLDRLHDDRMLQLPVISKRLDSISLWVDADCDTQLWYRLHQGPANRSTFPEDLLTEGAIDIPAGQSQWIDIPTDCHINRPGWHFLILAKNPQFALHMTETPPGKRWNYPRPALCNPCDRKKLTLIH